MTANSIHLRVPSNEKNTEKTLDNKKGDKLTDNDRAFGHWPLLCNDLGVCSGRQKQTFGKWTHNVGHNSSVSVFNTDCNGIRHISKTNGVTERWIFIIKSIHWCANGANYFCSSTEKSIAHRFEITTEDTRTTPHKAMGVGSLTTIHRASKCLPQVV